MKMTVERDMQYPVFGVEGIESHILTFSHEGQTIGTVKYISVSEESTKQTGYKLERIKNTSENLSNFYDSIKPVGNAEFEEAKADYAEEADEYSSVRFPVKGNCLILEEISIRKEHRGKGYSKEMLTESLELMKHTCSPSILWMYPYPFELKASNRTAVRAETERLQKLYKSLWAELQSIWYLGFNEKTSSIETFTFLAKEI